MGPLNPAATGSERLGPRWLLSADSNAFRPLLPSGPAQMGPLNPAATGPNVSGLGLGLVPADGTEATEPAKPWHLSTLDARTLPRERLVHVNDSLDLDRMSLVYRIPIDNATVSVGIELRASGPGAALREAMTLTDEAGRELATRTPPPGGRSLWIGLPPGHMRALRARGVALYLTVSVPAEAFHDQVTDDATDLGQPADSGGTDGASLPAPGFGFVLVVRRVDIEPSSAATGDGASLIVDVGPWSGRNGQPSAQNPTAGAPGRIARGADASAPAPALNRVQLRSTRGVTVPTGSLPRRATGPLGGILAPGGEETVADRADPAQVDLALIDLSDPPDDDNADAASHGDGLDAPADDGPRDDAVVSVRGPGGVPLFGASLMTESRSRRPWDLSDLPVIAAVPVPVVTPAAFDAARRNRDAGRTAASRRVTSLAALTAAGMMAAHLGLPDLTDPLRRWARPPR